MILTIDPGYDRVGWAIGESINGKVQLIKCGCIQTAKDHTLHQRYQQILSELAVLFVNYSISTAVFETLYFAKNQKTAMNVSEARGVMIGYCLQKGCQIGELTPTQIKSFVAGDGNADKKAVEKMVRLQVKVPQEKYIDDAMDAVALLIAYLSSYKLNQLHSKKRFLA